VAVKGERRRRRREAKKGREEGREMVLAPYSSWKQNKVRL